MNIFVILFGIVLFGLLCLALYHNYQGTKPLPDDSEAWRRSWEAYGPKSTK
jgi:hypothetical protein